MIPLWEAEKSSVPSADRRARLTLLEQRVAEMEAQAARVAPEDRVHYEGVLRSLYWMMIEAGREYYTSSSGYQAIRRQVEASFGTLGRAVGDTVQ